MRDRDDQQRVAVLRRCDASSVPMTPPAPAAVVDDDLLAEPLAEVLRDQPPDHVVAAAGRERNDQPDRLGRILLRGGDRGQRQQDLLRS